MYKKEGWESMVQKSFIQMDFANKAALAALVLRLKLRVEAKVHEDWSRSSCRGL